MMLIASETEHVYLYRADRVVSFCFKFRVMIFFVLLFKVCHKHVGFDRTVPVPRGGTLVGVCVFMELMYILYDELRCMGFRDSSF